MSFKWPQRISISKLAHGLYHTNNEANKLYGYTSICPCCHSNEETFSHIFRCPDAGVVSNHLDAQSKLKDALMCNKTPEKLAAALLHGMTSWTELPEGENIVPLYRGTVLPDEVTLVQAFLEQMAIGWDHLLRGRISLKWSAAYQLCTGTNDAVWTELWAKNLVRAIWAYSKSLWEYRNGEVHGHTLEEEKLREKERLQSQVEEEFSLYHKDPFIVSPQFAYLFTRKTKEERQWLDRDALSSWLHTVAEAISHRLNFRQSLTKLSTRFFKHKKRQLTVSVRVSLTTFTDATCGSSDETSIGTVDSGADTDSTAMASDFDPG